MSAQVVTLHRPLALPAGLTEERIATDRLSRDFAYLLYTRSQGDSWLRLGAFCAGREQDKCADNAVRHLAKYAGLTTALVRLDFSGQVLEVRTYTAQNA